MRAQFRQGRAAAISIITLLLFAFCAAAADTPDPAPDQVFLFEHVNYDGAALYLTVSQDLPDLRQNMISIGKSWNDRISSIKTGKHAKVVLYEHPGCDDRSAFMVLQGDGQSNLEYDSFHSIEWGDRTSSFKVRMSDSLR